MSDNRREALEALRDKVKAGEFDRWSVNGAPLTAPQKAFVTRAYHGSLDAAKALHDAVLPGWRYSITHGPSGDAAVVAKRLGEQVDTLGFATDNPARAWLIAILSALISETPKGETP